MPSQNELAQRLKALHKPGSPVILANVYDGASAQALSQLRSVAALATASYAVAATYGVDDNDMTQAQNLDGIARVAAVAARANLPLTADLQDGYADVAATITQAVKLGVVGCNLEDDNCAEAKLRPLAEAVERVKAAVRAAAEAGVPDFVVNARTDVLGYGGSIDDAVERGRAYLDAGATTVFVWGGPKGRGVSGAEVKRLAEGLGGMLNVSMVLRDGYLDAKQLGELGVARISVGPALQRAAMAALTEAAGKMYGP